MVDYSALAAVAYAHAEKKYSAKNFRYDVIVECMELSEIAEELKGHGITHEISARAWVDRQARAYHEQELNQAWDGPESCIGSDSYDPRSHDPGYER